MPTRFAALSVLAIFSVALPLACHAAPPAPVVVQGLGDIMSAALGSILSAGSGMTGDLVGMGKAFLAFAVLIEIFLLIAGYLIEPGVQELMASGLLLFVRTAIPAYLILNWPTPLLAMEKFFTNEVFAVLGVGSAKTIFENGMDTLLPAIGKFMLPFPSSGDIVTLKFWDIPGNTVTYLMDLVGVALVDFLVLVFVGGATAFLILGFLIAMYGPQILILMGLIFGPMLVAWMPFRAASWIARGWYKYMLASCMALIVGAALASVFISAFAFLATHFQTAISGQQTAASILTLLVFLVPLTAIMLFMVHLVFNFESIAESMSGATGTGGHHNAARLTGSVAGMGTRALSGLG